MIAQVTIPIRVVSEANRSRYEHWGVKARRATVQKKAVAFMLPPALGGTKINGPATITLTRISPREFDDDNLERSLKAIRDAVARVLGRDDGPKSGLTWVYASEKADKPNYHAVRVEIEAGNRVNQEDAK